MKVMVIYIKRILISILLLVSLISYFTDIKVNGKDLEPSYYRGSAYRTVYSRDVPIDISVCYSYEEDNEEKNSFRKKHVIRIENCSATCKNLDYSGFLNAAYSYTDTTIYVSVYGSLLNKKDPSRSFLVNETFTFSI